MRRLRKIALYFLVVMAQLYFVLLFTLRPVNLARIPYRYSERRAAFVALGQAQSPENKAAVQHELELASHYTTKRQLTTAGIVFATILVFEGFVIYFGRKQDDEHKSGAQ